VYAEADIPEEIKDNGIPVIALTVGPADFERVVNSEYHSGAEAEYNSKNTLR
jgi:hypothetical protein